jgi:hypothetical protein
MKNQPAGMHKTSIAIHYAYGPYVSYPTPSSLSRSGRQVYVKNRYNGLVKYAFGTYGDLPVSFVDQDGHAYAVLNSRSGVKTSANGRYEWIPAPDKGSGYYRLQFTEGPAVKSWMEAQDRIYLNELSAKPEHYERFLKELTPRERLSEADQKACLGLVMTDPHHQTLAREYADKKAEIERMLGMGGASERPSVAAPGVPAVTDGPSAGAGSSPLGSVEDKEAIVTVSVTDLSTDSSPKDTPRRKGVKRVRFIEEEPELNEGSLPVVASPLLPAQPEVLNPVTVTYSINVVGEAVARQFVLEPVPADNNCGFTALGVTRAQLVDTLLAHRDDVDYRRELAHEIIADFSGATFNRERATRFGINLSLIEAYHDDRDLGMDVDVTRARLMEECEKVSVYERFVRHLGEPMIWLGHHSAKCYAKAKNINLRILGKIGVHSNELVQLHVQNGTGQEIVMLWTDRAGGHYDILRSNLVPVAVVPSEPGVPDPVEPGVPLQIDASIPGGAVLPFSSPLYRKGSDPVGHQFVGPGRSFFSEEQKYKLECMELQKKLYQEAIDEAQKEGAKDKIKSLRDKLIEWNGNIIELLKELEKSSAGKAVSVDPIQPAFRVASVFSPTLSQEQSEDGDSSGPDISEYLK